MPSSWKLGKNRLWADLRRIRDGCKGQVAEIPHIFTITELHINPVFFCKTQSTPAAWSETWRISCLLLCVLALLNSPVCEHSWALVPSKADQRQQDFQHHIRGFAHVRTQTRTRTHMEIFPQKKKKSFQVKRSLWGYQQCRLIDIFSVSLLVPSGIDKAERNDNFPAWLPISRADGQWQNIWSSVRAPLKN